MPPCSDIILSGLDFKLVYSTLINSYPPPPPSITRVIDLCYEGIRCDWSMKWMALVNHLSAGYTSIADPDETVNQATTSMANYRNMMRHHGSLHRPVQYIHDVCTHLHRLFDSWLPGTFLWRHPTTPIPRVPSVALEVYRYPQYAITGQWHNSPLRTDVTAACSSCDTRRNRHTIRGEVMYAWQRPNIPLPRAGWSVPSDRQTGIARRYASIINRQPLSTPSRPRPSDGLASRALSFAIHPSATLRPSKQCRDWPTDHRCTRASRV